MERSKTDILGDLDYIADRCVFARTLDVLVEKENFQGIASTMKKKGWVDDPSILTGDYASLLGKAVIELKDDDKNKEKALELLAIIHKSIPQDKQISRALGELYLEAERYSEVKPIYERFEKKGGIEIIGMDKAAFDKLFNETKAILDCFREIYKVVRASEGTKLLQYIGQMNLKILKLKDLSRTDTYQLDEDVKKIATSLFSLVDSYFDAGTDSLIDESERIMGQMPDSSDSELKAFLKKDYSRIDDLLDIAEVYERNRKKLPIEHVSAADEKEGVKIARLLKRRMLSYSRRVGEYDKTAAFFEGKEDES